MEYFEKEEERDALLNLNGIDWYDVNLSVVFYKKP